MSAPDAVGDPFFSSLEAWRGEIVSTMPRLLISSAISLPVHWLIGRPVSSGFSQANCTIWQTWSAVKRGGVPGRGRSSRRSSILKSSREIGCNSSQRWRHNRTVSLVISSSLAISRLFLPEFAKRTIRPRRAFCWLVLCRLTNFSKPWRSISVRLIDNGFGPGIFYTFPKNLTYPFIFVDLFKPSCTSEECDSSEERPSSRLLLSL